jgi:hypothetical protein
MLVFFFLLLTLVIITVALAGTIFWIWMIIDCAQNRFLDSNTRLVWILVIVFTHLIGAFIYFLAGRRPRNAMMTAYPGYPQGPIQYPQNQVRYQQPYTPGPTQSTQYAPQNPRAYADGYRNTNRDQNYQPNRPPQAPQPYSGEQSYYESPQATYPHEQFSRPQE